MIGCWQSGLAAEHAGVPLREIELPSLAIDLERGEDIRNFLAQGEDGHCTRALLAGLGRLAKGPHAAKAGAE